MANKCFPADPDKFQRDWNASTNRGEVVEKTGYPWNSARTFAWSMRKHGYEMRSFQATAPSHDLVADTARLCGSMSEVADQLGVCYSRASVLVNEARRAGRSIPRFRTGFPRLYDRRDLVRRWQKGETAREIAEAFGLPDQTISSAVTSLRRNGVPLRYSDGPRGCKARKRWRIKPKGEYKELAELAKSVSPLDP